MLKLIDKYKNTDIQVIKLPSYIYTHIYSYSYMVIVIYENSY